MTTPNVQRLSVCNDYDLITLRQAMRQQARAARLTPPQQARFTAAVSELARLLLHGSSSAVFTVGVSTTESGRAALEVACAAEAEGDSGSDLSNLFASPALTSARKLVDDACLLDSERGLRLAMRMWLVQ
jgi:hypothetical protein